MIPFLPRPSFGAKLIPIAKQKYVNTLKLQDIKDEHKH